MAGSPFQIEKGRFTTGEPSGLLSQAQRIINHIEDACFEFGETHQGVSYYWDLPWEQLQEVFPYWLVIQAHSNREQTAPLDLKISIDFVTAYWQLISQIDTGSLKFSLDFVFQLEDAGPVQAFLQQLSNYFHQDLSATITATEMREDEIGGFDLFESNDTTDDQVPKKWFTTTMNIEIGAPHQLGLPHQ